MTGRTEKLESTEANDLDEIEETAPQQVDLDCDECGAQLTWDPVADALSCSHCGSTREVERGEGTILERPLAEAGSAARGLGLELRVTRCDNCDARVTFEGVTTSESCVFCGSANVLEQAANRNQIRPESLIPLDIGREKVQEHFRHWLRRLWFRPNALRRQKRFQAVGIYVPAWTFDCDVDSSWSADSGK